MHNIYIASKLKLEDRIQILDDNDACISIKDHKEGFPDKISCRLINLSKTDIGKISKQILDNVNTRKNSGKSVEKHLLCYRMVL